MSKNQYCKLLCIVFVFFRCVGYSQNTWTREFIKSQSNITKLEELRNQFNNEYLKFIRKARKLKVSTSKKSSFLDAIIDGTLFYEYQDNAGAASISKVDKIWKHEGNNGLTGKNLVIGHWEVGGVPLANHIEFGGRVEIKETVESTSHATHTAGTLIAKGINEEARGMASEAVLHARDSRNDEAEMVSFALEGGILSNHSYSIKATNAINPKYYGYYSQNTKQWDLIAHNAPYYLICNSVGNNRDNGVNTKDNGYDVLLTKATAKNILVVGAVQENLAPTVYSSYGPTDDLRIKPDIMARGHLVYSTDNNSGTNSYSIKSGTSMATPVVTGTVALLQQLYHEQNAVYMKSATVKALLINSADELGAHPGPDFANGWGLLNAESAAIQIQESNRSTLIVEETLQENETFELTVQVDGKLPLSATLVWTDVPGNPILTRNLVEDQPDLMLVNDLDMRIIRGGEYHEPWTFTSNTNFTNAAIKGDNFRDNVEKIEIPNTNSGMYTIKITHKNELIEGAQHFSLVVNGLKQEYLQGEEVTHQENKIQFYPNPTSGKIIVESYGVDQDECHLEVYDVKGRLLQQHILVGNKHEVKLVQSGVYFFKVITNTRSTVKKIIVR